MFPVFLRIFFDVPFLSAHFLASLLVKFVPFVLFPFALFVFPSIKFDISVYLQNRHSTTEKLSERQINVTDAILGFVR